MKWLALISVVIAVCAASVTPNFTEGYKEGDRYFYFSDDDGILHLVDAEEPADETFLDNLSGNPANNGYWLYTRANPSTPQMLYIHDTESIRQSNFEGRKTTVFTVHGWNGHGRNLMNTLLTPAFLEDDDVNVIVVDWSEAANNNYITAKRAVAAVGRGLGMFVNWLVTQGAAYNRIHLVGFSLGGHLVGNAGREAGGLIRRITALDPAGPLWYTDRNRIVPSDGQYVEVIHTDIVFSGISMPCGDADHYPNGGFNMPGCSTNSCSHSLVYEYMAATVRYNHLHANECEAAVHAIQDTCTGSTYPMGNSDLSKSRTGIFRVNTEASYPFY